MFALEFKIPGIANEKPTASLIRKLLFIRNQFVSSRLFIINFNFTLTTGWFGMNHFVIVLTDAPISQSSQCQNYLEEPMHESWTKVT